MPANGLILLGYARSAGSGDAPVPGTVISRRDRGVQQKQKQKKAQEQEADRKVRERQEIAAQYLKKKWKQEDDKRKRKKDDAEKSPRRHRSEEEDEKDRKPEHSPEPAPDEGKWVSKADANNRIMHQVHMNPPKEVPRPETTSGSKEPEKRGFLPGAPRLLTSINPQLQQQRKKALANAFGVDDDDDEPRRELELAARVKRQRVPTLSDDGPVGGGSSLPASKPGVDMYDQLRRLAEWKRKCKGNRVPMPDDLVSSIGATAGISTLSDVPVHPRRNAPSRSRSRGGGSRRFAERKGSRSRSRKRSRSRRR